jgi:hypothetical protein
MKKGSSGIKNRFWETESLKYISTNKWNSMDKSTLETCKRDFIKGVEVRLLPPEHFLYGEYGLFATQFFSQFDVIGEYVGKVVDNKAQGHYVAALEDKSHEESVGLDAMHFGNEMRFINSYINVSTAANVTMRTVYIGGLPHIVIVCMRDIVPGEEFLFDYGEAYNNAYLLPKVTKQHAAISDEELREALPFCDEDMDDLETDLHEASLVKGEMEPIVVEQVLVALDEIKPTVNVTEALCEILPSCCDAGVMNSDPVESIQFVR